MRGLRRDDGNVVIIVALMMTVLFGAAALSIDAGMMYTTHSQLQTGADAAAIAIAHECAEQAVANQPEACNGDTARAIAGDFLDLNVSGAGLDVPSFELVPEYDSRAGRITVTGTSDEPSVFARMLGVERQRTGATATARWGPLTAVDTVFSLALCRSEALVPDTEVTLMSVPSGEEPSPQWCDGAPDDQPMGWMTRIDGDNCSTKVTLLPADFLEIAPSDQPPPGFSCEDSISRLLGAIERDGTCALWLTAEECTEWQERRRTRVIAVYDASRSSGGAHPAHSLIGFRFTGARLGDREEHRGAPWGGVCDPEEDTLEIGERQCIRGEVTTFIPPDDGPIVDLSLLDAGGIPDTTVLDVRLVD